MDATIDAPAPPCVCACATCARLRVLPPPPWSRQLDAVLAERRRPAVVRIAAPRVDRQGTSLRYVHADRVACAAASRECDR